MKTRIPTIRSVPLGKKGFTLIELIIVVIIIAILAAIAAPMMSGNVNKAKRAEAVAALGSIRNAERCYQTEKNGVNAASINDLSGYMNSADLTGQYYSAGNYFINVQSAWANGAAGNVDITLATGAVNGA